MSEVFISLARKWRPRRLADMVGQEYVVRALQNAARENRLHHALLFSGTRGIGKTTLARIVAMLINCQEGDSNATEPCLKCDYCRDIMEGRLTDVIEQDAASHTQVDKMRDLLESAVYAPARARYKVFIIDEVHMLTKQSFNAMLKTLEEPPPHVKFILATTDPQKLPATVRSRCLCFSLLPLTQTQIGERLGHILGEEGIPYQAAALTAVARLASGSMRDALSILDQAVAHREGELQADDVRRITGDIGVELLADILNAVADNDAAKINALTESHIAHHISFDVSLSRLAALVYKIALTQALPQAQTTEDQDEAAVIQAMSKRFSAEQLQVLYEIALRARQQLPLAPDGATGFAMALLRMTLFSPMDAAAGGDGGGVLVSAAPAAAAAPVAAAAPAPSDNMTSAPGAGSDKDKSWRETVAKITDSGVQALAGGSVAEYYDDKRVLLVLDKSQAGLVKSYHADLEAELKRLHGEDFQVELRVGESDAAAVANQNALLDKAQSAPLVRDVQAAFPQATLQEESVRPVE